MGDFIRFNNNNIWEIVKTEDGRVVTCLKREIGKRENNNPYNFTHVINEDTMATDTRNFNYLDWKSFYGEQRLKNLVADFSTEQNVLPLIYFIKYILGFNDDSKMERVRSTKWIFRK